MKASIRPACLADAADLPAIEKSASQLFGVLPGLQGLASAAVMSPQAHQRLIALGSVWVAQAAAGQILGFISTEALEGELHIWELSVHAAHQHQGIGKHLVQAARAHAAVQGLLALTLTTFQDVPWNAPWYARMGFVPVLPGPGDRLHQVLQAEAQHGLPPERRLAMRWLLRVANPCIRSSHSFKGGSPGLSRQRQMSAGGPAKGTRSSGMDPAASRRPS